MSAKSAVIGRTCVAENARNWGNRGTHRTPTPILKEIRMSPDDCPDLSPKTNTKVAAYRLRTKSSTIIAAHGRGFCFCGATGNCAFWIYRLHHGRYMKILEADMVQTFGFLSSRTNGLPDLAVWSHGSVFRS